MKAKLMYMFPFNRGLHLQTTYRDIPEDHKKKDFKILLLFIILNKLHNFKKYEIPKSI